MWVVMRMSPSLGVVDSVAGEDITEIEYADGMVGALPIFESKVDADAYAVKIGGVDKVVEL